MIIHFVLLFVIASFGCGFFAGWTLKYVKKTSKDYRKQVNYKINESKFSLEDNNFSQDESNADSFIDIIKARQKLEYILQEEKRIKESIVNRNIPIKIRRFNSRIDKLSEVLNQINEDIKHLDNQRTLQGGDEQSIMNKIAEKNQEKQVIEDFRNQLISIIRQFESSRIKTGNPRAADIVRRTRWKEKEPK